MNPHGSRLWLCIELPRLPLDALSTTEQTANQPAVIYAQRGAKRWVIASAYPKIAAGEALGSVQARFPDVRIRARDTAAESAALQAVALAAYELSDRIVIVDDPPRGLHDRPHQAVLVDVAPSLRLFGGLEGLLERAQQWVARLPYQAQLGFAPTPESAVLAARGQLPPIADDDPATLRMQLAALPLTQLRWPLAIEELLGGTGHRRIADLLQHNAASLAARLGPAFPLALQRLFGELPDPRPWFQPPVRYRRRLDLDVEIEDWQALLFPLRRLFDEFEHYLRARQVAVTELHLTLARRRTETESLLLRTTTPTQSAETLFRLLRERWQSRGPTAPARELRLRADRFVALASPQTQLFDDGSTEGEAWNTLVDRVRARLGDHSIWRPGLAEDHRPERAWMRDGASKSLQALPPRPLWLLHKPRRLRLPAPVHGIGERITGGWWDSAPIKRDYYRTRSASGQTLWIYQDLDDGLWYEHGRFD